MKKCLQAWLKQLLIPEGNYYGKTFNIVKERADKPQSEKIAAIDSTGGFGKYTRFILDPTRYPFLKRIGWSV